METQESNPGKRRKFFKRAAIATLIGGIAAGIGFKAFAQGGGCGWHRCGYAAGPLDPAAVDQHLDRALKHLYVEIDATDEQKRASRRSISSPPSASTAARSRRCVQSKSSSPNRRRSVSRRRSPTSPRC